MDIRGVQGRQARVKGYNSFQNEEEGPPLEYNGHELVMKFIEHTLLTGKYEENL